MECRQLELFRRLPSGSASELDRELKRLGLAPHLCGVGKRMPLERYIHRSAEDSLPPDLLAAAQKHLPPGFRYVVIKYHEQRNSLSFTASPDWDESPEPIAGESYCVYPDGTVKHRPCPKRPQIYHHRWLFVRPDYQGFDVLAAKQRSLMFLQLRKQGIISVNSSRIGYLDVWQSEVLPILNCYLSTATVCGKCLCDRAISR